MIDYTLAFYKDQVAADATSEQLCNKWVDERFLMIHPFIEKVLPALLCLCLIGQLLSTAIVSGSGGERARAGGEVHRL